MRTQEKDELVDRCNLALEVLRLTETQKTELSATLDEILRLIHRHGKPVDSRGRVPPPAPAPPAGGSPAAASAHLRGKKVLEWTPDRSRTEKWPVMRDDHEDSRRHRPRDPLR